jgi:ABC-type phosphate/phosphonate transport system substrate-binding protein
VYWTNLVARKGGPIRVLADAFGKRMAFTTADSQSGYHAPRFMFVSRAVERDSRSLFGATVGPLITPRRVVKAVLEGEADIGPVDSYAFDLLRKHEPGWMAPLDVIETTMRTPIPPMVGAASLPAEDAKRLTDALLSVAEATELADVRDALLLRGFAPATAEQYAILRRAAEAATKLGYPRLE